MNELKNVAFHVLTRSGRYSQKHEHVTNEALDCKHEILDRRNEIK